MILGADNDAGAGSDDSDFDGTQEAVDEIAASAGRYVTKSDFLPKKIINFKRMNDITRGHRAERVSFSSVRYILIRNFVKKFEMWYFLYYLSFSIYLAFLARK